MYYDKILDNLIKEIEAGNIKTLDYGFISHDTSLRETSDIRIGNDYFIVRVIEWSPCRTCAGEDLNVMNHGYFDFELLLYDKENDQYITVATKRQEY